MVHVHSLDGSCDALNRMEEGPHMVTRCLLAKGKVQRVMFRQTFIRGAISRQLKAGATNLKVPGRDQVAVTLEGAQADVDEYVATLRSFTEAQKPINSWGATIHELHDVAPEQGRAWSKHQVTTSNVDSKHWSGGCDFYILRETTTE